MNNPRQCVLQVAHGERDDKPEMIGVYFCHSSASLAIGRLTVHILWTELAEWQRWLAETMEKGK